MGTIGNKGNRRSGYVKGTHSGLRRGQLPWRKDVVILERINLERTLNAQGYSRSQMLPIVNQLMVKRGQPEMGIDSLNVDFVRLKELIEDERKDAAEFEAEKVNERIAGLTEAKTQAWRGYHDTGQQSLNRSAYINAIRAIEMDIAKLQHLLDPAIKGTIEGKFGSGEPIEFTLNIGESKEEK